MASFHKAVKVVFKHEGGLVNDPDDPGGVTNFGITLPWLRNFEPNANADLIGSMSYLGARDRYCRYLWIPLGMDRFTDDNVATKIFDASIQFGEFSKCKSGHEGGPALAQIAANMLGAELLVDGHLGPKSVIAINKLDPVKYVEAFCEVMLKRYKASIKRDPTLKKFLPGWETRAAWPNIKKR